ncbi:MAG: alpha/beta hydrolase [Catenulispora sp.]
MTASAVLVAGTGVAISYASHLFAKHQDSANTDAANGLGSDPTTDSAPGTSSAKSGSPAPSGAKGTQGSHVPQTGDTGPMKSHTGPKATGPGTVTTLKVPSADDDLATRPVVVYRPAVPAGTVLPVLYLLHGVPGEPDRIMESVKDDLDRAFTTGGQAPFIVAAPTGGGTAHQDTEWADAADGKDLVESYLIKKVIPAVEGPSPRTAAQRAVAGFSMGGYGAANLGLRHPDLFGQFVSLAGYFHVDDPSGMFGSDRTLEAANTPDAMVKKAAGKRVLLLEDQDETDSLIDGQAAEFAQRLHDCDCGVDLNWHLEPGGHSYDFVTNSFSKVIAFLDQGF